MRQNPSYGSTLISGIGVVSQLVDDNGTMQKISKGWTTLSLAFALVRLVIGILYGIGVWLKTDLASEPEPNFNEQWQAHQDFKMRQY